MAKLLPNHSLNIQHIFSFGIKGKKGRDKDFLDDPRIFGISNPHVPLYECCFFTYINKCKLANCWKTYQTIKSSRTVHIPRSPDHPEGLLEHLARHFEEAMGINIRKYNDLLFTLNDIQITKEKSSAVK